MANEFSGLFNNVPEQDAQALEKLLTAMDRLKSPERSYYQRMWITDKDGKRKKQLIPVDFKEVISEASRPSRLLVTEETIGAPWGECQRAVVMPREGEDSEPEIGIVLPEHITAMNPWVDPEYIDPANPKHIEVFYREKQPGYLDSWVESILPEELRLKAKLQSRLAELDEVIDTYYVLLPYSEQDYLNYVNRLHDSVCYPEG